MKKGLSEKLNLRCSACRKTYSTFYTSSKITNGSNKSQPFDINIKSVYASQTLGLAGLKTLLANMDLPSPVEAKSYQALMKLVTNESIKIAEKLMQDAEYRLKSIVEVEQPDKIEIMDNGKNIAHVSVTLDGTWQRRGHCSKIGVVFLMSIRTGEVLDYIVKSIYCHACQKHSGDNKESNEYKEWSKEHKNSCQINHIGSSGEMETSGAVEMFLRSISELSLKYTTFIGDGDTGCFGKVMKKCEELYGESYKVVKEECVGHIQKTYGFRTSRI